MSGFKIAEQLAQDCHYLGKTQSSHILLMKNSLVPWLVIVPEVNESELFQIESSQQLQILQHINHISKVIKEEFKVDKINVASIGNIVKQMHIHIVGRFENDYCWPGVVWGATGKDEYDDESILKFKLLLKSKIKDFQII